MNLPGHAINFNKPANSDVKMRVIIILSAIGALAFWTAPFWMP